MNVLGNLYWQKGLMPPIKWLIWIKIAFLKDKVQANQKIKDIHIPIHLKDKVFSQISLPKSKAGL